MTTKTFDISDVLSITDGRLVSRRMMDGVYDILNHLSGQSLMTHELPAACRIYRPRLLAKFPQLAGLLDSVELSPSNIPQWLDNCASKVGESFDIESDPEPWREQDAGPLGNLAKILRAKEARDACALKAAKESK